MFSHLLLIACICIVIALISYFFYWNRFIAFILGHAIRIFFWNQEGSSAWVEIGSIHFSLLTGRILLKDVRYHSSNQTVKIVKGQIQWRYWIRKPTSEEDIFSAGRDDAASRLWSCRIQLSFQGVEWFLYNRTAAYEHVLDQLEKMNRPTSRASSHQRFFGRFTRQDTTSPFYPPSIVKASMRVPSFVRRAMAWFRYQLPTLDPKDLLPLGLDIQTGAIILGNPSTPNLLVAEFQDAIGTFGITASKCKYDLYRQVLNIKFQKALIRLVQNEDYVDPMTTLGAIIHERVARDTTLRKPNFYQGYRAFFRLWRQIKLYNSVIDYFRTQRFNRRPQSTKKMSKSVADEETPVGADFSAIEYAIERKILEAQALDLSYYVDVVGEVPSQTSTTRHASNEIHDIGNCDTDPEWGFNLVIHGGFLRYGPWADRQRAELQRAFFPPLFADSEVTTILRPGDKRKWTALQIFIELRDETILHIPFREASKDWQWDGKVDIPERPRIREAASMNIVVGDRSAINYVIPLVAGPAGYESTLEVHLDTISVTSSLNDIRLVSSESCRIRGEFPTPLHWSAERKWTITTYLRQPTLFLLRDHLNMFTDLGKDWVSGPPTDYQKFIPMIYVFNLEMHHFEWNLYANDQNIVDRPLVKDENTLVTLKGPYLGSVTTIPSKTYRPESTLISFSVSAPDIRTTFSLPRWNTHVLNTETKDVDVLISHHLTIGGSYRYFSEVREDLVEQLKLNFEARILLRGTSFRAYGWAIRCFMVLRDNYFGSFTHFQTLSEYLEKRQKGLPVGDPINLKYRHNKNNMLQVEINLCAQMSQLLLPLGLICDARGSVFEWTTDEPSDSSLVILKVPEIQLELRIHDHYMDMSLNMDTIKGVVKLCRPTMRPLSEHMTTSLKEIFLLGGIDITAHRLFGPQPRTATYFCIWEISMGPFKGSMSPNEAQLLTDVVNSFRLNFADVANSPAEDFTPAADPDVTFFKLSIESIEATIRAPHAALLTRVPEGLRLNSNDLGASQYHRVTSLVVPQISVSLLVNASREREIWLEAAEMAFDIHLDLYKAPAGHKAMTSRQKAFVASQDRFTGRAKHLLDQLRGGKRQAAGVQASINTSVYLPQPALTRFRNRAVTIANSDVIRKQSKTFSVQQEMFESEEEEGFSEADRDARLARTRTSTPAHELQEDSAMSSGDESDDADLTEAGSVEEDWSESGDSLNEHPVGPLMAFYSPLVRHFTSRPQVPFTLNHQVFEMIKERAAFLDQDMESFDEDGLEEQAPIAISGSVSQNEDLDILRLRLCQTWKIFTTPLLLQAVLFFEEDIKNIVAEPSSCIDSLLVDCLAHVGLKRNTKKLAFETVLPRIMWYHVQHVNLLHDTPHLSFTEPTEPPVIPSNLDTTSVLNFDFRDLHFSGVLGDYSTLEASLRQARTSLETSLDKRTLESILGDSVSCELLVSASAFKSAGSQFQLKLGDMSTKMGNQGPELVTTTLTASSSTASLCRDSLRRLRSHHLETIRGVVHVVLEASEGQGPVIDHLSTIQPSYLVQKGTPNLLRTDTTFRFLYHLQSCLSSVKRSQVIQHPKNIGEGGVQGLSLAIESRLSLLDQDTADVGDLTLLDPAFFGQESKAQLRNESQVRGGKSRAIIHVQILRASATIFPPAGGPPTQFTVDDSTIDIRSRLLDLVQINSGSPSSASQTSLRSKPSRKVHETLVSFSIGVTSLNLTPHLMYFAQHILRVQRRFMSRQSDSSQHGIIQGQSDRSSNHQLSGLWSLKLFGGIQQLHIQAAAENLVLVFGIKGMQVSCTLLLAHRQAVQSINQSFLVEEIYFQARSPADHFKDSEQDVLAALVFRHCRSTAVSRPEARSRTDLKLAVSVDDLQFQVPRSALHLYRFIGEWRADYLPGIDAAIKTLLQEYKGGPPRPRSPAPSQMSRRRSVLQIHCAIQHFEISLQVMHGTWLSWEIHQTIAYFDSSGALRAGSTHAFGLQSKYMLVNVAFKPIAADTPPSSRIKLSLPPLSLAGQSDGYHIHALILLDFIDLKVKPSHWDTLLSVQQKFGQDFNDLVALIQKSRLKKGPSLQKTAAQMPTSFATEAHCKMRGFRIGLEGMSSTAVLECQDINGRVSNSKGWSWDVGVSDLALSLAPRFNGSNMANRNHRSAFVTIDFRVNGSDTGLKGEKTLVFSVSKMHAVMQPSSIGEFGDFVDNLQAEMLDRREERTAQMAAFKEKTQSILKTFDLGVGETQSLQESWITRFLVNVSIRSIGVAFPLTHSEVGLSASPGSSPVRAFLFSIKSVEFSTRRGETGDAVMQRLSFQFVSRFRQSVSDDFTAERHYTRNCLVYPEMTAQLRSSNSGSSRQIWITADVSGFVLDIDSNIPRYIFALIDVYRQGKERVERLSVNMPSTPFSTIPMFEDRKAVVLEKRYSAVPTSSVFLNLVFYSGKVRLFSDAASGLIKAKLFSSNRASDLSDEQALRLGAEIFSLPVVSVFGEYRATPATQKLSRSSEQKPSALTFKSIVHSSNNILRPTLLPFLTELVGHLEDRMHKSSTQHARSPTLPPPLLSNGSLPRLEEGLENSVSTMQICFSLQIDQSNLELTCQPDVNVVAGLHWKSGGFVINVLPGASRASLSGTVGGLTIGLKHGFLSEDCVRLDARNLSFSLSYNAIAPGNKTSANTISIVLDTEFLGSVRFSRLQDVLCFKAVWLDRIPIFNKQSSPIDTKATSDSAVSLQTRDNASEKRTLLSFTLIRIREIKLEVDLGQSISKLNLELHNSILRMHLTDDLKELFLFVDDVSLAAKGNLSGHAHVTSCVFQTIRRSEGVIKEDSSKSRMLELRLTSGSLIAALDSDQQKLLHYRAQPLEVEIVDDWPQANLSVNKDFRPLQLSFSVRCPDIFAAATIGAIPKLLSYVNKFKANLDAQRQGAFRESQTFRATRTPKPDNPLSAVAEAMLLSAKSRFREADPALSYSILQHMSLRLDALRLVVFPRSMRDLEVAQFVGRDVQAELNSQVGMNARPAQRDIHLAFSSMVISKYTQIPRQTSVPDNPLEEEIGPDWPMSLFKDSTEATIVGLPSMRMNMTSEEHIVDSITTLLYDFHSEFVRRAGMRAFEDIYITLNISLYAWLTILRKNLAREMDQVRATEDWRVSMSTVSAAMSTGSQRRKKVPEPLSLGESPRSATLPSAGTAGLSPYTPSYVRPGITEQLKTPQTSRETLSPLPSASPLAISPVQSATSKDGVEGSLAQHGPPKRSTLTYKPRKRHIERLTMRQLGEATPDVMHPFFMKKAGFSLEDSLPQYVHEYATIPLEEIMEVLLKLYSQQLLNGTQRPSDEAQPDQIEK